AEETAAAAGWRAALAAVSADDSLHEVILSGGDPLALATPKLAELTGALAAIPHVRRLRIHTRLPVVLPERVDDALAGWLSALPCSTPITPTSSMRGSMRRRPRCAAVARPCSTRRYCCAGSTIRWTPRSRCMNRPSPPACCPTTCTSSTASPAPPISRFPTTRRWPCMPRCVRACPVTCCRGWCARSPAMDPSAHYEPPAMDATRGGMA